MTYRFKTLTLYVILTFACLIACSSKPQGIVDEGKKPDQGSISTITPGNANPSTGTRCEITASPTQVAAGSPVTLTSQTYEGEFTAVTLDNKQVDPFTGVVTVSPTATTEYFAIATLKSGEIVKCSVTVKVTGSAGGTPSPVVPGNDNVKLEIYGNTYSGQAVTVAGTAISCNGTGQGICDAMIQRNSTANIIFPNNLNANGRSYTFSYILCENQAGQSQKWFTSTHALIMDQNYRCTGWYI